MQIPIDSYSILIFLSVLVILSYLFDLLFKWTYIPSVLLLITTGIILRYLGISRQYIMPDTNRFLELFGIIGLILIVLEGALNLKLSRQKLVVIRNSFASAFLILLVSAGTIGLAIGKILNVPFQVGFINALPLAVISSAVVIPCVTVLGETTREFIVYESIFSDILGIIVFNFMLQYQNTPGAAGLALSLASVILVCAISVVCVFLLFFLLNRIKLHIKFFLLISLLVILYSLGKILHLSSLILILMFAVFLNNTGVFLKGKLRNLFDVGEIEEELKKFKMVVTESTFLIRTFFFILFGFSIQLGGIFTLQTFGIGILIVCIIFIIRYVYLRHVFKAGLVPELLIAPRGLITILLYYSIPPKYKLGLFGDDILFFVIMVSGILMMAGLFIYRKKKVSIPFPYDWK